MDESGYISVDVALPPKPGRYRVIAQEWRYCYPRPPVRFVMVYKGRRYWINSLDPISEHSSFKVLAWKPKAPPASL